MHKATFYTPENIPGPDLLVKVVKNCVITRSKLVMTATGVHPASLYENLALRKRIQMNLVGLASVVKNRVHRLEDREDYYFLFNPWGTGYYHWITEVAIKYLVHEDQIRRGTILLPENYPDFVADFLSLLGFTEYRELKDNTFVKRLSVITNPNTNHYDLRHISLFRDRLMGLVAHDNNSGSRRLYVSRKFARGRKVTNEEEVSELLSNYGFESLYLEKVPFREQIKIFSECDILVSIHGAGLTNAILAPRSAKVIELYPRPFDTEPHPIACFQRLCGVLDQSHTFLFCDREFPDTSFDLELDNIKVDLDSLEREIVVCLENQ